MTENEPQSTIVMKELSDIKEKLAINTTQTSNVAANVDEIKRDVKTLPSIFINRSEYDARHKELELLIQVSGKTNADHEERLRSIESKVWRAIGALAVAQIVVLPILFYLLYNKTI